MTRAAMAIGGWALVAALIGCDAEQKQSTSSSTTTGGGSAQTAGGMGGEATAVGGAGGTGGTASGGGGAGGEGAAQPVEVENARCGLSFDWLPPESVGAVVSTDTPHSTLTVGEAIVAKLAVESEGIAFDRIPQYETLAHRMVYTTQDRGSMRQATSLVVVPQVDSAESFPVLLFHHGTTGMNDTCAPSYGWEDTDSPAFAVALLLSLFSSLGYIVVAPDYLGQDSVGLASPELHPYLIGEPTAVAVWDAARAAEALLASDGSMATAGPIALWGASQGGHAAMYSAIYQPFYAPDMDLRTGVYTVPPSDLETHMTLGTRELRSSSGNVVLFYSGVESWYQPNLAPPLSQIFVSPYDTQIPQDLAASCSPDTLDGVTSVDEVFTTELIAASATEELVDYEPWGCFARENSVTRTSLPPPSIPGLVVLGENDTLVDPAIERAAFDTLCSQGHSLSYLECAGAEHEEGFFWAIDDALDYIDARIAGTPVTDSCVRTAAQTCSNTP